MPRNRSADPTIFFVILAILCYGGSVAAWYAHKNNNARVLSYHADPACGTPIASTTAGKACTVERATATGRWIHSNRNSRYYRVAFTTSDGVADSVELKGSNRKAAWNALPAGTAVVVERFTDPDWAAKRHVTAVRSGDVPVPTGWNPDYRARDSTAGMVFLSALTVFFGSLVLWGMHQRRIRRERA